jgi:hypothetical protein
MILQAILILLWLGITAYGMYDFHRIMMNWKMTSIENETLRFLIKAPIYIAGMIFMFCFSIVFILLPLILTFSNNK